MVHFNWFDLWASAVVPVHVATFVVAGGVLILLGLWARKALAKAPDLAPAGSFGIRGVFESLIVFIVSLVDSVIGPQGRKYTPLFATVFLCVFFNNVLGLLPGMTPATDNLNTTIALGVFIFVVYNFEGLRAHGVAYFKQFLGPTGDRLLAPINLLVLVMLPVELVSHFVRPMSLGLRLQGNMQGDHTVLGVFLELTHFVVPVVFYFVGLFVCFMQAFVFSLLSMVYVSMAISHDH